MAKKSTKKSTKKQVKPELEFAPVEGAEVDAAELDLDNLDPEPVEVAEPVTTAEPEAETKPKRGRKPAPKNETAEERGKRLVESRMPQYVRLCRLFGNLLGNKVQYRFDMEQVDKMREFMIGCLDDAFARYSPSVKDDAETFSF